MSKKSKKHHRKDIEDREAGYKSRRHHHRRHEKSEKRHKRDQDDTLAHRYINDHTLEAPAELNILLQPPKIEYFDPVGDRTQHKIQIGNRFIHGYKFGDPRIEIRGLQALLRTEPIFRHKDLVIIPHNAIPSWGSQPVPAVIAIRDSIKLHDPIPLPPLPPQPALVPHQRPNVERCFSQNLSAHTHTLVKEFKSGQPEPFRLLPSRLAHLFLGETSNTTATKPATAVFRDNNEYEPTPRQLFKTIDPKRLSLEEYKQKERQLIGPAQVSISEAELRPIETVEVTFKNDRAIADNNLIIQIPNRLAHRSNSDSDDVLSIHGEDNIDWDAIVSYQDSTTVHPIVEALVGDIDEVEPSTNCVIESTAETVWSPATIDSVDCRADTSTVVEDLDTTEDQLLSECPTDGRLPLVIDQTKATVNILVSPVVSKAPVSIEKSTVGTSARYHRREARLAALPADEQEAKRERMREKRRARNQRQVLRLQAEKKPRNYYIGLRKKRKKEAEEAARLLADEHMNEAEPSNPSVEPEKLSVFQRLG